MLSILIGVLLLSQDPAQQQTPPAQPPPPAAQKDEAWAFSLAAFYVNPPGEGSHATTILYADRGPLHLEGRYNYEDLDTVSVFAGWTFEVGAEAHAAITPMIGGVFGDTTGVAPALEVDAAWKKLAFYSEAEYVIDTGGDNDDYFYSWSTLMWHFTDALALGLVAERSRIVDTGLDIQRGLAVQIHPGRVGLALYAYNLGSDDEYFTFSLDFSM
jgi:hypothetical protein